MASEVGVWDLDARRRVSGARTMRWERLREGPRVRGLKRAEEAGNGREVAVVVEAIALRIINGENVGYVERVKQFWRVILNQVNTGT